MSRLLDPTRCPDCRSAVSPLGRCSSCDLDLSGARGRRLWSALSAADAIVEDMRMHPTPLPTPPPTPPPTGRRTAPPLVAPAARTEAPPPLPRLDVERPARPRRLSGPSAPVVLLATGGLMVLVAAVLFLTISWSSLPLTVKAGLAGAATLTLVAVAARLTVRGLRSSAETLWALSLALMALDVGAAQRSGLVAASERTALIAAGALLVAAGLAAGGWSVRRATTGLVLPQVGAGVGGLVLAAAALWTGPLADGAGPLLGALLPLPVVLLSRRAGLQVARLGFLGLAVLGWLVLVGTGIAALEAAGTRAEYWSGLAGWPLLAAALVAAAASAGRRAPERVRVVEAAAALTVTTAFVQGPLLGTVPTLATAAGSGLALGAVALLAPRVWARGALVPGLVSLGLAAVLVVLAPPVVVARAVLEAPGAWWGRGFGSPMPTGDGLPLWLLGLVAAAGIAVVAGALRVAGRGGAVLPTTLPAVVALTTLVRLATSGAPLWTGVLALVLGAVATVAVPGSATRRSLVAAWLLVLAVALALPSALLSSLVATGLGVVVVALVARRDRRHAVVSEAGAPAGAVLGVGLGAYAAFAWTQVVGSGTLAVTITLAGLAAVLLVAAAPVTRRLDTRVAVEGSAALVGLLATAATGERVALLWALGLLCTAGTLTAARYVVEHDRGRWHPAVALPAALVTTALASGAAHAWTALAGASPLVGSLVVTLVGAVMLLLADLACRHTPTRLAAQVGATLTGASATLLTGSRTDVWLVAAVLGTSLTLAATRHLVRWDRLQPDARAACVAGAVLVLATGLAVRGSAGTTGLAGTPTTVLLAAVAASYLLGSRVVARLPLARLAVEGAAVVVTLAALATTAATDDAWLLQAVVATALVVAAARHLVDVDRRPAMPEPDPGAAAAGAVAAVVTVAATAWAVGAWATVVELPTAVRAVLLAAVAVPALLGATTLTRTPTTRLACEATAVTVGAVACAAAPGAALASVLLGVLGTAGAVLVLRHRDREVAAVPVALVLGLAELVRVSEALRGAPELVALPGAAVLLVAGARRAAADEDADTWRVLGAALGLALVPSLLLVLPDPVQTRTLLLGAAALGALALGGVRRWQAPYLAGAAVLVVIALRFLGPLAAAAFDTATGPWATFGLAGTALLVAGVGWERALARLRTVSHYVVALR